MYLCMIQINQFSNFFLMVIRNRFFTSFGNLLRTLLLWILFQSHDYEIYNIPEYRTQARRARLCSENLKSLFSDKSKAACALFVRKYKELCVAEGVAKSKRNFKFEQKGGAAHISRARSTFPKSGPEASKKERPKPCSSGPNSARYGSS